MGLTKEDLEINRQQIEGKSGFFSLDVSYVAPDDTFSESRKLQTMAFHPLDPEAPCPCGSGEIFGNCCDPLGLMRVFTLNPDGNGYSPMVFYSETWEPWPDQDKLRSSLKCNEAFLTTADSEDRTFWNYRGEKLILRGPGPLIFGTVELTPVFLKIEGSSRVRHANLRAALERALGEPLPSGKLEVDLPVHNKPAISADRPGAIIEEYRILRERYRKLTSRALNEIMRDELICAAKDLKMLGPDKVFIFHYYLSML